MDLSLFPNRRLRVNSKRRLSEHSLNYYRRALEGCEAASHRLGADNIKHLIENGLVRLASKSTSSFGISGPLPDMISGRSWEDRSSGSSGEEDQRSASASDAQPDM